MKIDNKKYGTFTEPGIIRFERMLPGPLERVWAYLTESEKRGKWLASGEMDIRIGGRVELNFFHANLAPHDDPIPKKYKEMEGGSTMIGRITRLEIPCLLSYTWGEPSPDGPGQESEVTFELKEQGDKEVLLVLTHRRLGDDHNVLISVAGGWHTHLGILVDHLEGKIPEGFWKVHNRLEKEYEEQLNK